MELEMIIVAIDRLWWPSGMLFSLVNPQLPSQWLDESYTYVYPSAESVLKPRRRVKNLKFFPFRWPFKSILESREGIKKKEREGCLESLRSFAIFLHAKLVSLNLLRFMNIFPWYSRLQKSHVAKIHAWEIASVG